LGAIYVFFLCGIKGFLRDLCNPFGNKLVEVLDLHVGIQSAPDKSHPVNHQLFFC
jgi:hypothetical protein